MKKQFFSGVPIEVREFLLRLLKMKPKVPYGYWLSVPIMFRSILPCISSVFTSISIPKSIAILVNNAFKTVQQSAKDAVIKTIPSSPSHLHASDK